MILYKLSTCLGVGNNHTIHVQTKSPEESFFKSPQILHVQNNGYALRVPTSVTFSAWRNDFFKQNEILANLKSCTTHKDLEWGKAIHAKSMETDSDSNIRVQTALINMYMKSGNIANASRVFDDIGKPDVVCWTTLILGYAENGEGLVALDLFSRMKESGCTPNSYSYVAALRSCTSLAVNGDRHCLELGRKVHSEIGLHLNSYVQETLIDMYSKCGSIVDARGVFDDMGEPDVVSWTSLILGYAENGKEHLALDLFYKMKASGCAPNSLTYIAALKACTSLAANGGDKSNCLKFGKHLHSEIGPSVTLNLERTLIDMYAVCGSMYDARAVFNNILKPSVVHWNALLLGYVLNGEGYVALDLFAEMKTRDSVSYVAALKACSSFVVDGRKEDCKIRGKEIHADVGIHLNSYVQSTLINMYGKCDSMADARCVFDSIEKPGIVSWNALICGYVENGEGVVALEMFSKMKQYGCPPNSVTYVAALKACIHVGVNGGNRDALERGRKMHSEIGSNLDHFVESTLIDMYAKCGSMVGARNVFESIQKPNAASWNVLLSGYVDNGEWEVALDLFSRMKASGCKPDSITYLAALKACTCFALSGERCEGFERGREVHLQIGHPLNLYVQNTLIDMYGKCYHMVEARSVFNSIQEPDVVSWNALLLGYAENGEGHISLDLFSRMKSSGTIPNALTYSAALKACGVVGALASGRKIHSEINEFSTRVVTCLIDFYAKCGGLVEAREVFHFHSLSRDITTWNALLTGYARFGDMASVLSVFNAMKDDGLQPDAVTFLCFLLCCSHAGMVENASEYLDVMAIRYRIAPNVMHYNCMVDVLGRANQLDKAILFIQNMPCNPNVVTWRTLLGACRKWKNNEIGRIAFETLSLIHKSAATYVLMAHTYGN